MESAFVHIACGNRIFTISPELLGSIKVKRDMEVVRKILRAVQEKNDLQQKRIEIPGLDDFTVTYHLSLLHQAGYIDAVVHRSGAVDLVLVRDLTWEGHEFAGALLADESTWQKIRGSLGDQLEKMPLKLVQDLASKALTAWAVHKMGL